MQSNPTGPSLPGKEDSIITGVPSHKDVIPRGFLLAVGNLAQQAPSARGHGISGSQPTWQGRSHSSHSARPSSSFRLVSETTGTLRANQMGCGCGEDEAQVQVRRQARDSPTAQGKAEAPPAPWCTPSGPSPSSLIVTLPHSVSHHKTTALSCVLSFHSDQNLIL